MSDDPAGEPVDPDDTTIEDALEALEEHAGTFADAHGEEELPFWREIKARVQQKIAVLTALAHEGD